MSDMVKFRGLLGYLSNMYECNVTMAIGGKLIHFQCAEAAFQACKCPERAGDFACLKGPDAKKLGRKVQLRENWNDISVYCMFKVVQAKFQQNQYLSVKLRSATDMDLVEENTWGDTFWGTVDGKGKNMLGRILRSVRDGLTYTEFAEKELSCQSS